MSRIDYKDLGILKCYALARAIKGKPATKFKEPNLSSLSRIPCGPCRSDTLHQGMVCIACGTSREAASGAFNPSIDSAFKVKPSRRAPSSKSRRKASAESGMPAHVAAEGGPR